MLVTDILAVRDNDSIYFFAISPLGRKMINGLDALASYHVYSRDGVEIYRYVNEQATYMLENLSAPAPELVIHLTDDCYDVALLQARQLVNQVQARQICADTMAYFTPLLDTAFAARDKKEIAKLVHQIAFPVERSFIIMRARQEFPELKRDGVTIDNWHEIAA